MIGEKPQQITLAYFLQLYKKLKNSIAVAYSIKSDFQHKGMFKQITKKEN